MISWTGIISVPLLLLVIWFAWQMIVWKRRARHVPKYYLYVSDAKVDMLYSQIPLPPWERIATTLTIGYDKLSMSVLGGSSNRTLFSKLSVVVDYINSNFEVGSIDEPRAYFGGTLPMGWGQFGSESNRIIFFGGSTDRTRVGLGGSVKHVIEGHELSDVHIGSNSWMDLASVLREELDDPLQFQDLPIEPDLALAAVSIGVHEVTRVGADQPVQFLARKQHVRDYPELKERNQPHRIVLGTPIYVALAD